RHGPGRLAASGRRCRLGPANPNDAVGHPLDAPLTIADLPDRVPVLPYTLAEARVLAVQRSAEVRTGAQLGFDITTQNSGDISVRLKQQRSRDINAVM